MPSFSSSRPSPAPAGDVSPPVGCEIRTLLSQYLTSSQLAEIVYRDDAGQIQTTHDVIRDLFSRAGQDFVYLSRGQMLRLDHVIMLDGHLIAGIA